jgi:hypothetical protein
MPRIVRHVQYGTSSERPTVGKPGDLFVIHSDTEGPKLTIWDQYNVDWVDVNADELEYIEGTITAGTATASKAVKLGSGASMNSWNFSSSYEIGDVVHKYEDALITAAQLLALNATPIQITNSGAATELIVFEGAQLFLDYNSAAYAAIAAGDDLTITYESAGAEVGRCECTGFLDQTNDEYRWVPALHPAVATAAGIDGTALLGSHFEIAMLTGEVTTGDSPLYIRTFYAVVPKSFA